MSFLRLERVCKSFGGLRAISDLGFEFEQGEIVGLIGPKGSGKTTVLNLISGFLKPDSGIIMFKGEDVTGFPRCRMYHRGVARTLTGGSE